MNEKSFGFGWLLGFVGLVFVAGAAAEPELAAPQRVLQQTAVQLREVMAKEQERLVREPAYVYRLAEEIFLPHVDMERMSALVLGRHWRQATPEERAAFAAEFQRLLVRTYATALHELGNWDLRFQPSRSQDGDRQRWVQSQVVRPGMPPVAVDYLMHEQDGRWLAYDVKVEGISLVTNYRSNFAQLIQRKGVSGLIDDLAARNAERLRPVAAQVAVNGVRG